MCLRARLLPPTQPISFVPALEEAEPSHPPPAPLPGALLLGSPSSSSLSLCWTRALDSEAEMIPQGLGICREFTYYP